MPRKKQRPFLDFAKEVEARGELEISGLCSNFSKKTKVGQIFRRFRPTDDDDYSLYISKMERTYWASGMKKFSYHPFYSVRENYYRRQKRGFTSLRKTIIAFCAVINKEV
jgi:hypothetical protein